MDCKLGITPNLLERLKCNKCGGIHTFVAEGQAPDRLLSCISCGNHYYFRNDILNTLSSFDDNYWDELYTEGLKGNSVHGDKLVRLVEKTLDSLPYSLSYFALVNLLLKNKAKFTTSIELGCGTGVYSLLLKKMQIVDEIILVDMSLPALKTAQTIFKKFNEDALFVLADATTLPFKNKSYDLSLSGGLIEHFKGAQLNHIVSEHCRVASNVACQFPASTPSYWLQRGGISLLNFGWPFGYELPLPNDIVEALFWTQNFQLCADSYHDMLSTFLTRVTLPMNSSILPKSKSLLNMLMKTESIMYFTQEVKCWAT
jgi:SAM-dependent methyltransferase